MENKDTSKRLALAPSGMPRRAFLLAGLALAVILGVVIAFLWLPREDDSSATKKGTSEISPSDDTARHLLAKWDRPNLVLIFSGQQYGYLQPCGCSKPQYGGLTRRYNLLQTLKKHGWPVMAVDLGDIPQRSGIQTRSKYATSIKALCEMNYAAVGMGEYEMNLPLIEALAPLPPGRPKVPVVLAANLRGKDKGQIFDGRIKSWTTITSQGGLRVGIIGAVAPSVRNTVRDADVELDTASRILPEMVKQVQAEKPNLLVLLYQGSLPEAKALPSTVPHFDVIQCLTAEEEPPMEADPVETENKKTLIVRVGHKGRYVGAVGVFATGESDQPYQLRYERVVLGPDLDPSPGKIKGHPIMRLMEDYARQVKRDDYLRKQAKNKSLHPFQEEFPMSFYVGSEACKKCHESEYETWAKSPHAMAYQTLVQARNPSLRQFDSECIGCHVTGWEYKTGFMSAKRTPRLKNTGCENCHGPCSEHIDSIRHGSEKLQARINRLINPYRFDPEETAAQRAKRIDRIDQSCRKCHDLDNDVNWNIDKWWDGKIVHSDDVRKKRPSK
jgi:hypothetical protein